MATKLRCNRLLSRSLIVVTIISLYLFSVTSQAQYFTGLVSGALGGAGRGASEEGEQILLNPAAIVHSSAFVSSIFYVTGGEYKNQSDDVLGFSLVDNTEGVAISGAYTFIRRERDFGFNQETTEDYHQVVLGRFVAKHVSMGATLFYHEADVKNDKTYKQWDGHLGFLYNPDPSMGFGFLFYNLADRDRDVPLNLQHQDEWAFGFHYIMMPQFRFRIDVSQKMSENPEKHYRSQWGVESHINGLFVVRAGLDSDRWADQTAYTLGIGFDGPKLKADYFYRKNMDDEGDALHGVDLRLPFW